MMIPYIPCELESEILSRVPATSLKQLRFTCKRWYALFKDPRFIKKNSGKAATQMVLKKDQSVYSFSFDLHGIHNRYDQFIEFTGKLKSLRDSEDVKIISEIFHCEGLLLCTTKDDRLVVWNPCTGQTRWLQSRIHSTMYHTYFLGYENNNKSCVSYKILSSSYCYRNDQNATVGKFEIYEFNSDTWRVLDAETHDWFYHSEVGVSLKGNTYSLDLGRGDPLVNYIERFDFTTERFERLPLPFQSCYNDDFAVLSVVREEKLALLQQLIVTDDVKMKIWVTNTKTDEGLSWSEFLVLDVGKYEINGITRVMSFLLDEEDEKVMCCNIDADDEERTRIYVVGKDINKLVYKEVPVGTSSFPPILVSYVPSLVQIPARQSNPGGKRLADFN